jgi:sialate O-acetylesterase
MKTRFSHLIIFGLFLLIPVLGWGGDLQLHPAFSSNMVLQRQMPVNLFGSGKPGATVNVTFTDQSRTTTVDEKGKWKVTLSPLKASSSPAVLTVKSGSDHLECQNVLVGDVWFCSGQSNMARSFNAFTQLKGTLSTLGKPLLRLYRTANVTADTPQDLPLIPTKKGQEGANTWQLCDANALIDFSPIAYYFAAKVSDELQIPVGVFLSAWGATSAEAWTPQETLNTLNLGYTIRLAPDSWNQPGICYNSLIHPFLQMTFKGFLWYQGESNSQWAGQYKILFPAMILEWRKRFHAEDRPFYFVQIAPYNKIAWDISGEAWAWLRDSQTQTLKLVPKTGMTVLTDLGEYEDIHPQCKEEAGERLALFALRDAGKPVEPVSPMFKSMQIEGKRCKIEFDHAESDLETRRVVMNNKKDQPIQKDPQAFVVEADHLKGFTICGSDRKFVEANAAIVEGHVEVWNDAISSPVAVRYGWNNFPLCNLFSKAGLPANPFRTDDFAMPVLKEEKRNSDSLEKN